ncbi:hypothetical protein M0R45_022895 [Rubus argutus]|uniref:Pentatricopeptide repeat-containing protein n=1 Tax=Rubus argutus TaxID=59490 RepID=A0AAW1WNQ7_RUBAR
MSNGLKPNVITYSTLIDAFCKEGMMQEAIKIFMDMKRVGISSNEFTYTSLINASCKAGYLSQTLKLKNEMLEAGVGMSIITYTALLDDGGSRRSFQGSASLGQILTGKYALPLFMGMLRLRGWRMLQNF